MDFYYQHGRFVASFVQRTARFCVGHHNEIMKITEALNPRRNYIAVAVFTYYNTSPGAVLSGAYCIQLHLLRPSA